MNNQSQNCEKDLLPLLGKMGLKENEAKVYLSVLKLGQTGTSAIVRETGLHGQVIYRAVDELIGSGLLRKVLINNRSQFIAEDPSIFLQRVDETKACLEVALPNFEQLQTSPIVDQLSFTQGADNFIKAELNHLKILPIGSEVLVISALEDAYWNILGSHMNEHEYLRRSRKISIRYLSVQSRAEELKKLDSPLFSYRLLPNEFIGIVNIGIFDDSFGLYIYTESPTILTINNKQLVESYRSFFESLWKMGK